MTTIKLSTPVEHSGVTYSEITFDEPTVGDLAAADLVKGETHQMLAVLSSMSDVPIPALKKIKAKEFAKFSKAIDLGNEQEATTGE